MNENDTIAQERAAEVRRIRKLLNQMGRLCEHATLTGALSGGATDVVNIYNQAIRCLADLEVKVTPLFGELPADATYDRVGVASKLLAGYIEDDDEAVRKHGHQNIIIGGLGNLGDLDKLKEVGVNIRENLADLVKSSVDKVKVVIDTNPDPKPTPQPAPAPSPAPAPTVEGEKAV